MKLRIAKAAAATLFTAALIALPTAAHADTYPPANAGVVTSPVVAPGGTVGFQVVPDIFVPGEPVTITLTGENAQAATLAYVKFAVQTKTLGVVPANAEGGVDAVSIRFPADASGAYTIAAFSPSSPGVTTTVSVASSGADAGDGAGNPSRDRQRQLAAGRMGRRRRIAARGRSPRSRRHRASWQPRTRERLIGGAELRKAPGSREPRAFPLISPSDQPQMSA